MTRFMIVGLGSIGRRHAQNLRQLRPDAHFTFVRHRGDHDDMASDYGARVVANVDEVAGEPFDLCVVATPSARHIDVLPALIAGANPLLVEKPIVTDDTDADRIAALLAAAPHAVRVAAFNMRYVPSIRDITEVLERGLIGRVARALLVAGQWLPDWRPGTNHLDSYSADAELGGGVELDLSHEFDLARWWFGELAPAHVSARRESALGLRSNESSLSVLVPTSGSGPVVTVSLDYLARPYVRRYQLVGDEGTIDWDVDGRMVVTTGAGDVSPSPDREGFDIGASYVSMMQSVLEACEGAAMTGVQSLEDGLASSRLAIRVRNEGSRS